MATLTQIQFLVITDKQRQTFEWYCSLLNILFYKVNFCLQSHGLVIAENSRLKSRVKEAESELEKKDNALTQAQIVLEQKTSALKRTESALQEKASALKETEDALRQAHYQIQQLRQEMDTVRQGTIDYVLQHMSEFSKTRSTDV